MLARDNRDATNATLLIHPSRYNPFHGGLCFYYALQASGRSTSMSTRLDASFAMEGSRYRPSAGRSSIHTARKTSPHVHVASRVRVQNRNGIDRMHSCRGETFCEMLARANRDAKNFTLLIHPSRYPVGRGLMFLLCPSSFGKQH